MPVPGLAQWLHTAQGRYVLDWELQRTDQIIADVFGFNALQLGLPDHDFLRISRIRHRWHLSLLQETDLVCDFRQLPFPAQSIDLVILPHVLEFYPDPHQIVREVERVLIPEGRVLIFGFNPVSLWGAYRYLPGRPHDEFPWNGDYLYPVRVRDWLHLLGFELERTAFGAYAPPWSQEKWLRRWRFMETAGDRWWGIAGGVYLLHAVKRVQGVRLLTSPWRKLRPSAVALLPARREGQIDLPNLTGNFR